MKPIALHCTLATAFTALLALASPEVAAAQSFGEQISVIEVEIPVRVLRDGEPVRGLAPEDFEVFDDGEPREIVNFRTIDLARMRETIPKESDPTALDESRREASAPAVREGRDILLVFDFVFSRQHKLKRSVDGAREMIAEQLHPQDRVAIAFLTGGGANLVLGFTDDPRQIGFALDAVEGLFERSGQQVAESLGRLRSSLGEGGNRVARLNDRFGATAAVAMLGATDDLPGVLNGTEGGSVFGAGAVDGHRAGGGFSDPLLNRIGSGDDPFRISASLAAAGQGSAFRTVTQELARLATLLRDVRGQKEMLYLSEGFPSGLISGFASPERARILRYLEDMFEAMRRAGWTLHAVDVGGIPSALGERGFSADALHAMSSGTGGTLLENYNLIERATAEMIERTSVTYVLTLRPGDLTADGRFHSLEVRLRDRPRGTRLLHRPGYYAPKPATSKSSLERQLDTAELLLGEREIDELGVRVRAGALPIVGGAADGGDGVPAAGVSLVPFVIEVPTRRHLDASRRQPLEFELQAYAVDPRGGVQDLWLRNLRLDPRQDLGETLERGGFRVLGGMVLPPGEYRLRVLARERGDGRTALSTLPLTVPARGETLLPLDPLVVDRSGDWLELGALPGGGADPAEPIFRPQGHLLVPPVSAVSTRGQRLELMVPVATREAVELSGRLRALDGPAAEAPIRFDDAPLETAGDIAVYSAWIDATLAPGDYELEVTARRSDEEDGTTGSRRVARLTVLD